MHLEKFHIRPKEIVKYFQLMKKIRLSNYFIKVLKIIKIHSRYYQND